MSRPYIWEIMFPSTTVLEVDFPVTFQAGVFYQVPVKWCGAGVITYMEKGLEQGLVVMVRDLDGDTYPMTKEVLYRMYRSLLSIGGKL